MKLIACAPDGLFIELMDSISQNDKVSRVSQLEAGINADLIFYLHDDFRSVDFGFTTSPVLINSVTTTLGEAALPPYVSRINAWPGFINRGLWEIVSKQQEGLTPVLAALGKQACYLKDEIGMISPRVIAMIVNEAYFALGDGVSTKTEIDIAMKLGTNYPAGPFEWSEKIGLKKIVDLLSLLSLSDNRYIPASTMVAEASGNL